MPQRLFLMGMPGCGKSSTGKLLAGKLNYPFYDLDTVLEEGEGRSVMDIFRQSGEENFRRLETRYLQQLLGNDEDMVLSLGGGTPCYNDNLKLIKQAGTTIYLKAGVGLLVNRLQQGQNQRPLLRGKSPDELRHYLQQLLKKRKPYYEQADKTIDVKDITHSGLLELFGLE